MSIFDCEECGKCDQCLGISWTPSPNYEPISTELAEKLIQVSRSLGSSARRSLEKAALESMGII